MIDPFYKLKTFITNLRERGIKYAIISLRNSKQDLPPLIITSSSINIENDLIMETLRNSYMVKLVGDLKDNTSIKYTELLNEISKTPRDSKKNRELSSKLHTVAINLGKLEIALESYSKESKRLALIIQKQLEDRITK